MNIASSPSVTVANPRINPCLRHIHGDVGEHDEDSAHQHRAHDQVDVVVDDGIVRQLAHARPGKDALYHDYTSQKVAKIEAQLGDHRTYRIAQGMLEDYLPPAQPFGPGRPNIV